MHLCWGNYEGPHHCDVPLADIIDVIFTAKPAGLSFEAANPRHAHEWKVFETVKLPDGKVLIPGVIESKTNFIEHPELIAQRRRQPAPRSPSGAGCAGIPVRDRHSRTAPAPRPERPPRRTRETTATATCRPHSSR